MASAENLRAGQYASHAEGGDSKPRGWGGSFRQFSCHRLIRPFSFRTAFTAFAQLSALLDTEVFHAFDKFWVLAATLQHQRLPRDLGFGKCRRDFCQVVQMTAKGRRADVTRDCFVFDFIVKKKICRAVDIRTVHTC